MELTVGARLRSAVDTTQVVVVRAPDRDVTVHCGGRPLLAFDAEPEPDLTPVAGQDTGTTIGKRYADPSTGLELLCTRAGTGALFLDGAALPVKSAKPLPASD